MVALIFGTLQDQVQHFNARAEDYHRRHGDEESPFQACLLGTAQRDETIIENAVGGEYCSSTSVLLGFLEDLMLAGVNACKCTGYS